jgi:hypothetical protein
MWSKAYLLFAAGIVWCMVQFATANTPKALSTPTFPTANGDRGPVSKPRSILLWIVLAAVGASVMLATTNQLCLEFTVVPLLWVAPLSLYLLTYVICFASSRARSPAAAGASLVILVPAVYYMLRHPDETGFGAQLLLYSALLFASCMTCHGWLARLKPSAPYLTLFYLCIAAGGAMGGAFVSLLAPQLFKGYWEYPIALLATCALALGSVVGSKRKLSRWRLVLLTGLSLALGLMIHALTDAVRSDQDWTLRSTRNFHGVLRLVVHSDSVGPGLLLRHGGLCHGTQYTDDDKREWPTTYYGEQTGIGLAMRFHPDRQASNQAERALRIGVVGLGAGTMAALGQPGDTIRFYEIDPDIISYAQEYFTYTRRSPAAVQIVLGDARLQMERELAIGAAQRFDILAIDAFTSGAIPSHLLTAECMGIYLQHLETDGLLLFHISNKYMDLSPVMRGLAAHTQREIALFETEEIRSKGVFSATWAVLTQNRLFLEQPDVGSFSDSWPEPERSPVLWTDGYTSLWRVISF